MNVRAHIFVSGRVQGVFFRVEINYWATKGNVTGWVRNTSDGKVEAILEGKKENVEKLIEFCRNGPNGARVTKTEVQWKQYLREFTGFTIRRTVTL